MTDQADRNATNPYLQGSFAPIDRELDAHELEVIGEIPSDLAGTYVRNGPNPKHAPIGAHHWFDGDGMLHAISFRGGRATYRNRWVRTEHLAAEDEAGRALWTGLMEPTTGNPRGAPYKNTANTDVAYHNGTLLASWYIGATPYRIALDTLETLGPETFGAPRPLRFSAHHKVDPASGELLFFDYGPTPPFLTYGVVGATGALEHHVTIDVPGPRLPHDMAITEQYAIVMDLPVFFSPEALRQRKWIVDFHRELPARFGVLPRRGDGASVRWFEAEPCYIYHVVNAWEEGGEVVMIGCRVADPIPPADPRDGVWARMMANLRVTASLHEWRFDLETGQTRERPLDDRNTEFPSMNMRRIGQRTRYAYNVSLADTPALRFDGLVKYDTETGAVQSHAFGPGRFGSEAPFAPIAGATAEDDGYLVSFVNDEREGRSEAVVLDARDLDAGPLARVLLPQRVPLGFHACWVGDDERAP